MTIIPIIISAKELIDLSTQWSWCHVLTPIQLENRETRIRPFPWHTGISVWHELRRGSPWLSHQDIFIGHQGMLQKRDFIYELCEPEGTGIYLIFRKESDALRCDLKTLKYSQFRYYFCIISLNNPLYTCTVCRIVNTVSANTWKCDTRKIILKY